MPIEPFEITTVYPDGRTETRMSTPEEIAQREADIAAFEADRIAREQAQADLEAKRASARAKLAALGLTEEEVAAAFGL
jgi:hypothetical protein